MTTQEFSYSVLRFTARIIFTVCLYGFALVGLWYVGTTAALAQFGLTIEKAQQIQAIGDVLFEQDASLPPMPSKKEK